MCHYVKRPLWMPAVGMDVNIYLSAVKRNARRPATHTGYKGRIDTAGDIAACVKLPTAAAAADDDSIGH